MIHEQSKKRFDFPSDYVVIDLEMTGLSVENDYIIELAGLKVKNKQIVGTFQNLVKPPIPELSEHVISLTSITNEMLVSAPSFFEIISSFLDFLEDLPIVGHNIVNDIAFLNKELTLSELPLLQNDYIDTLPISRKLFPEFIHHKLIDMANYYNINPSGAHRALNDCFITKECFDQMEQTMKKSFSSAEDYLLSFSNTGRRLKADSIIPLTPQNESQKSSPIYEKTFVFTGILSTMSRREAMCHVVNLGGLLSDKLNMSVDFLVVGQGEEEILVADGGISRKVEKARKLQNKGCPIQLISEEEFLKLLPIFHNKDKQTSNQL